MELLNYLKFKRTFIFLDEWLSYLMLIYIYNNYNVKIFYIVLFFVILFNSIAYLDYWKSCNLFIKLIK